MHIVMAFKNKKKGGGKNVVALKYQFRFILQICLPFVLYSKPVNLAMF